MKITKLLPAIGVFAFCVSFGSIRAQDNPAQAAAREALMKQMDQVQAPEPQPPAAAPVAPAVVAKPAAEAVQSGTNTNTATQEQARAALLATMATTSPQQSSTTSTVAGPVPIVAPGLPISMTKEQQLQALLARYKADQITPEQYHTQRAAILAQP